METQDLIELLTSSTLFEANWYLENYPDVKATGLGAVEHYLKYGSQLQRNPSPSFNTSYYLSTYRDVAESGMNPLVHYLQFGLDENRLPLPPQAAKHDPELLEQQAAESQMRELRMRLLNLGFQARALAELNMLSETSQNKYLRDLALWELAVWHANRYQVEDAQKSIGFLEQLNEARLDQATKSHRAIMLAEAYDIVGQPIKGRQTLDEILSDQRNADLYLAYCRHEAEPQAKLRTINKALELHHLASLSLLEDESRALYDRLSITPPPKINQQTKVTIIVPAYNAQSTIRTTLESLLAQTWQNLEIIVSDDCSTDATVEVAADYLKKDSRISIIRNQQNTGPYVARNKALKIATGDFFTCNDADDWSHPEKIATQVQHLIANPKIMANTSQQARVNDDLIFHRRGNPGFYLQFNISSLMFRREAVLGKLGYWDSVRFAADSEYMRRLQKVFGKQAIEHLATGPLSFQRQSDDSLTGSVTFGYHGYKMGARKTYEDNHKQFHRQSKKLFLDFPIKKRPFPIPEPMQPEREVEANQYRHFDVILASDFRMPGGTSMSNAEEIKANASFDLTTGLLQMSSYHMNPTRTTNPEIYKLVLEGQARQIVYGEQVSCDLLIIRLPWVLQDLQDYIPEVKAKHIRVIVNQPPKRDYGPNSESIYDLASCADNVKRYFGKPAIWSPIGPLVREALLTHHAHELDKITLSAENWHNIINIAEWQRQERPEIQDRINICRHSRDQYVKWPASREELEKVYPVEGSRYSVNILGGAETPSQLLGGNLPSNWKVIEFGKQSPAKFLAKHDVFVYYTHPDWIESFGRVIFEAMAVGLPVILPHVYQPLFKDAALYAVPDDVLAMVDELMANDGLYEVQVEKARKFVDQNFGYTYHAERMSRIIHEADGDSKKKNESRDLRNKSVYSQVRGQALGSEEVDATQEDLWVKD